MSASQQIQLMREFFSDEQLQTAREQYTDELVNGNVETVSDTASINKSIISLTHLIAESDKDFALIIVDRNTRLKTNKLLSINYKKFYNSKKRSKEMINYLNNLYNVKYILNSYNHMQRALNALLIEKDFEIKHV